MSWSTVDWENRQDIDIAEETGKTRERIRQIRREGNYSECKNKGRNREKVKFEAALKELIKNGEVIEKEKKLSLTVKEIAEVTGRTAEYVARALPSMGYKAKAANVKYDWESVDWESKGNQEIATEKNTSANYVSRQRSKYMKRGKNESKPIYPATESNINYT